MKVFWQSLVTAVISGATVGAGSAIINGDINWTNIGVSAGLGAIVGVVNHFRVPPTANFIEKGNLNG